jgi:rare lipoprotein A
VFRHDAQGLRDRAVTGGKTGTAIEWIALVWRCNLSACPRRDRGTKINKFSERNEMNKALPNPILKPLLVPILIPILALSAALCAPQARAESEPASTSVDASSPPEKPVKKKQAAKAKAKPNLDRTGETRHGKASFYGGPRFAGKKMADGTPMNPQADIAASKTLPLGTKARVTNLENGKSSTVTIKDRGPYVDGRIVDVSPKVAEKLEMKKEGVAPVAVTPITVPQEDGSVKPGSGATASGSSGNENVSSGR